MRGISADLLSTVIRRCCLHREIVRFPFYNLSPQPVCMPDQSDPFAQDAWRQEGCVGRRGAAGPAGAMLLSRVQDCVPPAGCPSRPILKAERAGL